MSGGRDVGTGGGGLGPCNPLPHTPQLYICIIQHTPGLKSEWRGGGVAYTLPPPHPVPLSLPFLTGLGGGAPEETTRKPNIFECSVAKIGYERRKYGNFIISVAPADIYNCSRGIISYLANSSNNKDIYLFVYELSLKCYSITQM